MTYDDFALRFRAAIDGLPVRECEIVTRAAERIARGAQAGLQAYGPLQRGDRRDMAEEAAQELGDGLFYLTARFVALDEFEREHNRLCLLMRDTDPCEEGSEIDRG